MSDYLIMKAVEFDKLPAKFKKYYPHTNALQEAGWWLQPKYDGCMGIAMMSSVGDHRMVSRTGEDYTASCKHILKEIADAAQAQSGGWDDFIVIGEVWLPNVAFPTISGMFRKQAPSKLEFAAHDLLPPGFNTKMEYRLRYADLCQLLQKDNYCFVVPVVDPRNALECALQLKAEGGHDGAILRDPNAGYTVGTVKAGEIVKVKPVMSLDLKVTNQFREVGAKTGRDVWSIEVEYKGVKSRVGSGMPHSQAELPAIHQIAEIECLGITEDGKLREPRFKGIRHDKVKPD